MDQDLERLKKLLEELSALEKDYISVEEEKKRLEALLEIKTSLAELQKEAAQADQIAENVTFKERFCKLAHQSETIIDIAELVTEVILDTVGGGLPVSIPAMIAIKIAKMAVAVYCLKFKNTET